jgi:hypothetical protein
MLRFCDCDIRGLEVLPTFRKNLTTYPVGKGFFVTLAITYKTTRYYRAEDWNQFLQLRENLMPILFLLQIIII